MDALSSSTSILWLFDNILARRLRNWRKRPAQVKDSLVQVKCAAFQDFHFFFLFSHGALRPGSSSGHVLGAAYEIQHASRTILYFMFLSWWAWKCSIYACSLHFSTFSFSILALVPQIITLRTIWKSCHETLQCY